EYGEKWHEAGMKRNKMNVFHDYIAVVEKFKSMGFRVAGFGRSSGGLLIGAVMTLKPSLLDVAAIGYPVLDMLKFHKLYVGAAWIPEYGDPEDRGDREYLLQYSPYHNLKEGEEYPPTIVYTGLYDDRVHPAHALKFYAKMKSFGNNVCLRIEASSGHSGSSPQVLAMEMADVLSFILLNLSKAH
ncbi:MAG: prolyl oligopeptidase family serine peptidase, partial [Desulfurococcaceae archaeon]